MHDVVLASLLLTAVVLLVSVLLNRRHRLVPAATAHTREEQQPQPPRRPRQPNESHPLLRFRPREATDGFPPIARYLAAKRQQPRPFELSAGVDVAGKVGEVGELLVDVCGRWEEYHEAKRVLMQLHESGVFQATEDSLLAQWEALHLLLHTLRAHHSSHFTITPLAAEESSNVAPPPLAPHTHHRIVVAINGAEFTTAQYAHCPLKLASLLVQEDLCILREDTVAPGTRRQGGAGEEESEGPTNKTHTLTAASVCFSFILTSKFNKPMGQIHTGVGGFKQFLQSPMNRLFASLRSRVVWRSNWGFRSHGALVPKSVFERALAGLHEGEGGPFRPGAAGLAPGTKAEVLVGGRGKWRPATVASHSPTLAGTYSVVLESGDREDGVEVDWISPLGMSRAAFAKGSRVSVDWKSKGAWYPGLVVAATPLGREGGTAVQYGVAFDDGDFDADVRAEHMRPLCDNPTSVLPLGCDVEVETGGCWYPGHITDVHCAECTHPHRTTPARLPPPHHAFHPGFSAQWDSPRKERTYDVRLASSAGAPERVLSNVPRDRIRGGTGAVAAADMFLKVEYQTLQRMPVSNHILFTVRTYFEPLSVLVGAPEAAATLATEVSQLFPPFAAYKGLDDERKRDALVAFLQGLAQGASG